MERDRPVGPAPQISTGSAVAVLDSRRYALKRGFERIVARAAKPRGPALMVVLAL
jgi:hypothetical protein